MDTGKQNRVWQVECPGIGLRRPLSRSLFPSAYSLHQLPALECRASLTHPATELREYP